MTRSNQQRHVDNPSPPVSARTLRDAADLRLSTEHHACTHGERDYQLFVPPRSRNRRMLIIMLHGCHQDGTQFAQATRIHQYAGRQGACVAYRDQSTLANPGQCWNWYDAAHQRRASGEPAILADLTRDLIDSHDIDPARVFVAGFSAGAAMAATLAVLFPDLYAALGVHSGVAHGAVRDFLSALIGMQHATLTSHAPHPLQKQIPTIVFHGDTDDMVHATHAEHFVGMAPGAGHPAAQCWSTEQVAPHDGRHGYSRTVRLDEHGRSFSELWLVHGGRHAWYGGDAGSGHVDPRGPDAAAEMMRFFADRK